MGTEGKEGKERKKGNETYDVDEDVQRVPLPLLHQLRRVMLRPLGLVFLAEIAPERLLAPRASARVRNGRKGGHGLVFAGILEELRDGDRMISLAACQT